MEEEMKLFVVQLGGRAEGCNTELHDNVFVVGESIDDTYPKLLDKWFGSEMGLHMDCYAELKYIDGYEVNVEKERPVEAGDDKLFFINYGAYIPGKYFEVHEIAFYVAKERSGAVRKAKSQLCQGMYTPHLDDDFELKGALDVPGADVDDVIELSSVDQFHIHLSKTDHPEELIVHNGYKPFGKKGWNKEKTLIVS